METVTDFLFLGFKITLDGDCRHESKRRLLLRRKAMTNLDGVLKSRNITLLTKVKAMFFPVVWYGCESWTIKKTEHQRTDVFELWCWIRLLRIPWTTRRSKQSVLKEISPEYSLEGLMLKLQYFGHLMQRTDFFEKTLMLGKIEGGRRGDDREWDGWMASPTHRACSNSCPLSRWCHPSLSSCVVPFNPSQHQGLFQWVNSSHEVAKVLEFQL